MNRYILVFLFVLAMPMVNLAFTIEKTGVIQMLHNTNDNRTGEWVVGSEIRKDGYCERAHEHEPLKTNYERAVPDYCKNAHEGGVVRVICPKECYGGGRECYAGEERCYDCSNDKDPLARKVVRSWACPPLIGGSGGFSG